MAAPAFPLDNYGAQETAQQEIRMKPIAMTLAFAAAVAAAPATAQSTGSSQPSAQAQAAQVPGVTVSKEAYEAISALQATVDAKDYASLPARVAAAEAVAKTKEDRYMIAILRLRGALALQDPGAIEQAIASPALAGRLPTATVVDVYTDLGRMYLNRKQYDPAAAALEKASSMEPGNVERMLLLAETRNFQGRAGDAVAMIQKAIAQTKASGQRVNENWYKRSVAFAVAAKLPNTLDLTREWLRAYPTPQNWSDTLRIYRQGRQLDDAMTLDFYRLARATKSLRGEFDYFTYADKALKRGFPGEAKAVLEEGFAAKAIDRSQTDFATLLSMATAKSDGDRASLDGAARTAVSAKQAIALGDAYYGYAEYATAAGLYRAALNKDGADKDLVNLRLGAALAMAGDRAGATAALSTVSGSRSEIAGLWLIHLSTSA